jgi:hypothetical protein
VTASAANDTAVRLTIDPMKVSELHAVVSEMADCRGRLSLRHETDLSGIAVAIHETPRGV